MTSPVLLGAGAVGMGIAVWCVRRSRMVVGIVAVLIVIAVALAWHALAPGDFPAVFSGWPVWGLPLGIVAVVFTLGLMNFRTAQNILIAVVILAAVFVFIYASGNGWGP